MIATPEETFSPAEKELLSRHVTTLTGPVFALVNLPEVVKGALFARYSRSAKSLRRLLIDEFADDLPDLTTEGGSGASQHAEGLYERVFVEYGDDSVAQLGGVHLACEQASNLLTKVLEWGRLASYLEQSTRYIPYDARTGGRYRYYRDLDILSSGYGTRYISTLDGLFDTYAALFPRLVAHYRSSLPKATGDSDFVHRQAVRAKAMDAIRGLLPAATLSNVGIYASGQAYEQLVLRMRAHPLPEAREYAELILVELRKVIPSFLRRVDIPDRGGAWTEYLRRGRQDTAAALDQVFGEMDTAPCSARVDLVDFDPAGEDKVLAAIAYPHLGCSAAEVARMVGDLSEGDRETLFRAYVGERGNRRHKPGRAFEHSAYHFDVVADYGAFRDLQRHRLLTVQWQDLTPNLGFDIPPGVAEIGASDIYREAMESSAELYEYLAEGFPERAAYAVSLGHRIRFSLHLNAREAMHLTELRSTPQGHPAYRVVAQEMHRQIAEVAGHRRLAAAMSWVDGTEDPELGRLEAERRAEERRRGEAGHR